MVMEIQKDFKIEISEYLSRLSQVIDELNLQQIQIVMEKLIETYKREGFVYIFGNGGSAATASHFVNDFNKGVSENMEKRFRFCCLNDNISSIMAIANDISYTKIFQFQLKNYLKPGDLVIGISGSGNSENVIEGIRYAKAKKIDTIAMVGYDGGHLKKIADYCIHIPSFDMQKVEDIHLMIEHIMMSILKEYLEEERI